jgi:hypothetical protein
LEHRRGRLNARQTTYPVCESLIEPAIRSCGQLKARGANDAMHCVFGRPKQTRIRKQNPEDQRDSDGDPSARKQLLSLVEPQTASI